MDNMFGEKDTKNEVKDTDQNLGLVLKDSPTPISYTKTNKLITALYMVTDIMDKDEPIKTKLRTLGTGIISDINSTPSQALPKISEIMSFLDIAGAVALVSEMNLGILRKEFFELKKAIQESMPEAKASYSDMDLSELFRENLVNDFSTTLPPRTVPTRIGVQKGSTLLRALKGYQMSDKNSGKNIVSDRNSARSNGDFEVLKKSRREEILKIIKASPAGATITDIRARSSGPIASSSEKTLQRELIGMLKDGVLKKTGEKRWSRYFLSN